MKTLITVGMVALIFMSACERGPDSPRGFSLPEGDAVKGEEAFVKYQCAACHSIEGIQQTDIEPELAEPIVLGGESARVTTYAELVTSVINPSHRISQRLRGITTDASEIPTMPSFNDVMTVTELVDLVTFLQPHYKVKPVTYTHYNQYHIPTKN